MNSLGRDLAQNVIILSALADTAITAGGGGDDTDANGISIDTISYPKAEALTFAVQGNAVLAASQTLALPVRVQDSADGSSWADVTDPRINGVATASKTSAAGAGTIQVVTVVGVPMEYCRRYVRCVAKPNLSAGGTDTARLQGVAILSGLQKV